MLFKETKGAQQETSTTTSRDKFGVGSGIKESQQSKERRREVGYQV